MTPVSVITPIRFPHVAGLSSHATGIRSQVYVPRTIPALKQRSQNHKQSVIWLFERWIAESGMRSELISKSGRKMEPQRSSSGALRSARLPVHLSGPSFRAHRNPIIIRLFLTQKITLIGGGGGPNAAAPAARFTFVRCIYFRLAGVYVFI